MNDGIVTTGNLNRSSFRKWDVVLGIEGVCSCLLTREVGCPTLIMEEKRMEKESKPKVIGGLGDKKSNGGTQWYEQDRVYDVGETATSIPAESSFHPNYGELGKRLRIRKLTPDECMRLMAFEHRDTERMKAAGLSNSIIYHSAGDSIVVSVLIGIFAKMLGIDPKPELEAHAEKLSAEGSGGGGKVIDDFYRCRKPREYDESGPSLRCNCGGLKVRGGD